MKASSQAKASSAGRGAVNLRDFWLCLALCFCSVLTYAPVFGFEFVSVDDRTFVVENPMVNQGLRLNGLIAALTTVHSSNWIPLTWLSHAADVSVFGIDPAAHHGVNLLLHCANACLVFLLLRRITDPKDSWKCAVVAALFALHPAHVETVAWVSERKGLLSTIFWLLTTLAYVRYTRRPALSRFVLVAVLLALGLMAKAMLVTLPFCLLLLDVWPLHRHAQLPVSERARRLVAEKLPLLAVSTIAVFMTVWAQSSGAAIRSLDVVPLVARFENAVLAPVRYLGILVWPLDLSVLYPLLEPAQLGWPAVASALLLGGISVLTFRVTDSHPYLWFGWCWFLCSLLPVIGLVQAGTQSIADRYTYVPFIGLFIGLVFWLAASCPKRLRGGPLVAATLVLLLVCGLVSRAQTLHWRDSQALWKRAASASPSAIAFAQLAMLSLRAGQPDQALEQAQRAVSIDPDLAIARHNLGAVLLRLERTSQAAREFATVLERHPDYAASQLAYAFVLHSQGQYGQAADLFARALTTKRKLMALPDVRQRYAESLRRQPLVGQQDFDAALDEYRRALLLRPDWPDLRQDLLWLLATHPRATRENGREAVSLVSLNKGTTIADLDTTAVAHAAAGDYAEAIRLATRALERAQTAGYTLVADSIRKRLELYRAGRSYVETPRAR